MHPIVFLYAEVLKKDVLRHLISQYDLFEPLPTL